MPNNNPQLDSLIQQNKDIKKALHNEAYQVIIQPQEYPYMLRLTYSKHRGGRIIMVEELDSTEGVITSCTFKGRSSTGDGCEWLKPLKQAYSTMKTQDWLNSGLWIDEHFQQY